MSGDHSYIKADSVVPVKAWVFGFAVYPKKTTIAETVNICSSQTVYGNGLQKKKQFHFQLGSHRVMILLQYS